MLLLVTVLSASAEFRRVVMDFQGTGCVSCAESLPDRLGRVRGVENVEVDLDRSRVTVHLAAGNKARLAPLVSRVTQDGTKILRVEVVAFGAITQQGDTLEFQPGGLSESYRLEPAGDTPRSAPQAGTVYEIRGSFPEGEPGPDSILKAESITAAPEGKQ